MPPAVADPGEAPLDPAEAGERLAQHVVGDAELARDRDRGERVLHIVAARHGEAQALDALVDEAAHRGRAARRRTRCRAGSKRRLERAHVGLRAEAVGDQAPVGDPAEQRLDLGMIDAQHGEAVERHVLDEARKAVVHRVELP